MPVQPSEVMRQAAEWVVQLRSPDRPVDCEQSFADWLRESPVHVREYLRAVEVWEGLAHPDVGGGRSRDEFIKAASDSNLVELPTAAPAPTSYRSGFRWRRVGFALALTGVFVLAYIGWQQTTVIKVTTGLGEQHSEVLPDHSVVELNTQSEIRVGFTAAERRVELVRGEAFFDVAKDPARPFIVVTDLATAKAVGTRFSVYRAQSGTIVTVAEGRVLVLDKQAKADLDKEAMSRKPSEPPRGLDSAPLAPQSEQPRPVQRTEAWYQDGFAWGLAATGFAGLAVGGGFLLSATNLNNDANASPSDGERVRLHDKASSRDLLGGVIGIGGAGLLVAGIVKLAIYPESPSRIARWNIAASGNSVMVFGQF